MFELNTIFFRTPQGVQLLDTTNNNLSRTERLLLLMVNGQSSVNDLAARLYSLPARRISTGLEHLLALGLITQDNQSQRNIPKHIQREQLEAFLQPADLDPTTAMIANFEIKAALKEVGDKQNNTVFAKPTLKHNTDNIELKIKQHLSNKTQTQARTHGEAQKSQQLTPLSKSTKNYNSDLKAIQRKRKAARIQQKKKRTRTFFIGAALLLIIGFVFIVLIRNT